MSDDKPRSWLERLSYLLSHEPKDKAELMEILRDAEERHLLSAEMLRMIESVMQVSEMQAREVMIPKSQMISIDKDSPLEELLPLVIESGHSRFPVMENGGRNVAGILLAKDLLKYCFNNASHDFNIEESLFPVVFVPQSKRLDILLREFRVNRNHMAIVLDEYSQIAGLITIEDVLEQIVGEIEDEYDIDEDDNIKNHTDGSCTVKASIPIKDFNEHFHTNFSDEEFDTIGGLVLKGFGHLPKRGETLKISSYRFKVLHGDNRRIHLLEVKKQVDTIQAQNLN
jgi:magnesium and cobalt transporter